MLRRQHSHIRTVAGGLVAATAIVLTPQQAALAQQAAEPVTQLEEIIVTARKREERLIDVPISMQAFSETEIKSAGITDIQALKDRAGFQVPQALSTSPSGRFLGIIVFRGLQGSAFGDISRDNSGSLFVDGAYVSGGPQSINTVDVDRIEVLKGPQNTYFGRQTFGGAVNFITRNPSEDFGGQVNYRGTARGSMDADLSLEGSLIPQVLTARITGYTHNKVAQYHANDGGDLGAEKTQGATLTLYAKPTKNLWARFRGNFQQDDDSAGETALLSGNTYGVGSCTGKSFAGFNERTGQPIPIQSPPRNYFCNGVPSIGSIGTGFITTTTHLPKGFVNAVRGNNVFVAGPTAANLTPATTSAPLFKNVPDLDHAGLARHSMFLSGQVGYDFDSGANMVLNVGYNKQDSVAFFDFDRTDADDTTPRAVGLGAIAFYDALAFHTDDLTIDARFASNPSLPWRVLGGASYYTGKVQITDISFTSPNMIDQSAAAAPVRAAYPNGYATYSSNFTDIKAQVPAIYAAADYDVLKSLTLTAEGRYQEDKPTSSTQGGVKFEKTFYKFLPRVSVKFHPNSDINVYATYAQGVQNAGISGGFASLTPGQQAYVRSLPGYGGLSVFTEQPELNAYEIGTKGNLMDGRLNYSVALYQNDWKGAVSTAAVFNNANCIATNTALTPACPLSLQGTSVQTQNNARIRGVELETTMLVTSALTMDVTVDYKDAKWIYYRSSGFNSFVFPAGAQAGDVYRGDGNHLGRVPTLSGTLSGTYRGKLTDEWNYYVRGDVLYTGSAWDSDLNLFKSKAYERVNTSLGFERDKLTLELFVTNLFNDRTYDYAGITVEAGTTGFFADRAVLVQPAQKREIGARVRLKF